MVKEEQCEECIEKVKVYIDDEITVIRIHLEELEDSIRISRSIIASMIGGQVE